MLMLILRLESAARGRALSHRSFCEVPGGTESNGKSRWGHQMWEPDTGPTERLSATVNALLGNYNYRHNSKWDLTKYNRKLSKHETF